MCALSTDRIYNSLFRAKYDCVPEKVW